MMTKHFFRLSAFTLTMVLAAQVQAAGYHIDFQSASALGNSGDAAAAEDAGTNWYNPAGLVYLPRQIVFSAFDVYAPVNFSGTATAPGVSSFSATGGAASHPNVMIPAFHLAMPFSDTMAFGLSVAPAWGFTEDYGTDSLLRYSLTRITTKSLDVSPSFAMKLNKQWSFGLGPDIHYLSLHSKSAVRTQSTTVHDSYSTFDASRVGYGGHIGLLYRIDDATRIGLNYRSKMTMNLHGDSDFLLGDVGTDYNTDDFKLRIPLPPVTTLSLYHDMTPCWAVMGSLNYDQWSVLREYKANNLMQPTGPIPSIALTQNMRNTLEVGVGTNYKLTETFMLRGAIKYLPTPTKDAYRQVSFPDGEKLGVHLGARYQYMPTVALDALYGHVFVKDAAINDFNPVTNSLASGRVHSSVDFIGAQVVWNI